MIGTVGISIHATHLMPPADFEYFVGEIGYDCVEINPADFDVIYNGRLHPRKLDRVLHFLQGFPCRYTVHSPLSLNLRDPVHHDVQRDIVHACLELCRHLGAGVLVVHYEERSADPAVEARFRDTILRAADAAGRHGITLAVENIETERMERLVEFVAACGHPQVGITLDFGHAYLAARKFGYGFLDSVSLAAPHVRHLHVSDNFGRFADLRMDNLMLYRPVEHEWWLPGGFGDLHLPPGWGEVPLREACDRLDAYRGAAVIEYRHARYRPWSGEVLQDMRELARIAGLPAGAWAREQARQAG